MATTLTKDGIRWEWSEDRVIGQYANGDWWVIGPITLISITATNNDAVSRASLSGQTTAAHSGVTINGTMFNPIGGSYPDHGFDSRKNGYQESLNMARKSGAPLSVGNNRVAAVGTSICSISSNLAQTETDRPLFTDFAVLTVVGTAPAAGQFRPPYQGTDKSLNYNKSALDYTRLKRVTVSGMSAPTSAAFAKSWVQISFDYNNGRAFAPVNNQPEYDRDMGEQIQNALLELHYDYDNATKELAYLRFVQLGIDVHGGIKTARDDGTYEVRHGNTCFKTPLIVAALALNDTDMKFYCNAENKITLAPFFYTSGLQYRWGIDDSTTYVTTDAVNITTNDAKLAGGFDGNRQRLTWVSGMVGMPEWGGGSKSYDILNGSNWGVVYRDVRHYGLVGHALGLQLYTGAKALNNHDAFFDNFDRAYKNYHTIIGGDGRNPTHIQVFWDAHRSLGNAIWDQTPVLGVAWITEDGTQLIVEATGNIQVGSAGVAGLTLIASGGAVTCAYVSGNGTNSLTFNLSRIIGAGELLCKYSYAQPGNGFEAYVGGADLASVTNYPVVNYRGAETGGGGGRTLGADTTPPTAGNFVINANGTTGYLPLNEAASVGAGAGGGLTLTGLSGGAVTLTHSGVSGSNVHYSLSRTVNAGETGGANGYTQPGNGIEDAAGNDLASFSGHGVTNNSTQGITPPTTAARRLESIQRVVFAGGAGL